jgi:hypothetical protein
MAVFIGTTRLLDNMLIEELESDPGNFRVTL